MNYLAFLREVHRRLQPQAYLEIGVRHGNSLALAGCRAVGVDPAYSITCELDGDVALVRRPSDDFFAGDPLALTGGRPYDLVFIDGLHLFEFALRDFLHAEQFCPPGALVIIDDVLPRSIDEAARDRHTSEWAGDIYSLIPVLQRYRPELTVLPMSTTPTGMLLVAGLDPGNQVLSEHYPAIMAEYRHADPQSVPEDLLRQLSAVAPSRVLASPLLETLSGALRGDDSTTTVREQLREVVERSLGVAYA